MKSFGYIFLVLAFIACGIIWQVLRRMSAGAQAFINPERYAIQKVVEMQQSLPINPSEEATNVPKERWGALVRYDPDIAPAAEQLRPFGEKWVRALGRDCFALQEDRSYLPHIVRRLIAEAQTEAADIEAARKQSERWSKLRQLCNGEFCTDASIAVLSSAENKGYIISVEPGGTIKVALVGRGTSFLRSNFDIQHFGQYM